MTLVVSEHSFTFTPRIEGWKPLPSAPVIKAVENPHAKDCPLCAAATNDPDKHSVVWHAYGPEKDVAGAVRAAQDQGIVGVTPKLVERHFPNHNYTQPPPLKRITNAEKLYLAEQLSEREQQILIMLYRQRVLRSRQLVDLFFVPHTKNDNAARKSAYRTLRKLCFMHMIYPHRVRKRRSPEIFYLLGVHAVPWVEQQEGRLVAQAGVASADAFSEHLLEHDSLAADVLVQMRRQLYTNRDSHNLVEVEGKERQLHLPIDCWYGARGLMFGYTDPYTDAEQRIAPDGFAALTFNDGRHRQWRLPFFYEWDSGFKNPEDTVKQLVDYVGFAVSGVVGKRFPQMNVEGYFPPVLIATSTAYRANRLAEMTREACAKYSPESVPPMFFIDVETLRNGAWAPGAWIAAHAEDPTERVSIAEHLLRANRKLCEEAPIHFRVAIAIDPDGAKPKMKNTFTSTSEAALPLL